jgi:PKD repeat protein
MSNATLTLDTPVTVPDGHWWLVFYPTLPFSGGGQYGRQAADTINDNVGQFINPGGAFGFGTAWQPWTVLGPTQPDIAFRLEGDIASVDIPWLSEDPTQGTAAADSTTNVAVTFDATGLTLGDYTGTLRVKTGDPNNATVIVPVTLHVVNAVAPEVSFTSNSPVKSGNPVIFINTTEQPGIPPTTEYLWDFGDGITMTVPAADTDPVVHVYAISGTYTVTLTACNVAGCDTFTDENIVVEPWMQFYPWIALNADP